MALSYLVEPAPGIRYGLIVGLQAFGCAMCVLLWVLQHIASQPGADFPSLLWVKDSGWWLLPSPFFPAVCYYSVLWMNQKSKLAEEAVSKKE
mmetsp:Transcript_16814/g.37961  ORF Transcript_16814/g.37961 Transcript_16814/m.37961 type:complete len:92 (-) Transcript_16814:127-402(-)